MDKGFVTFCICVMLCLLGFGFMFFALGLHKATVDNPVETVEKPVENSVVCEHDWVVTSEYVWYRSQYRNVSKCSKCGEVVR